MTREIWLDRGGTFCDGILVIDDVIVRACKVLSHAQSPDDVIRAVMASLEADDVDEVRMGTTVATNALLTRTATPVVLVVTKGFRDLLHIGDQTRPNLFEVHIRKPPPLDHVVIETSARGTAWGDVAADVDEDELRTALARAFKGGWRSVAVSLLHGHRVPDMERHIARVAQSVGFDDVTMGHACSMTSGYLARTETAVVDAALTPLTTTSFQSIAAKAQRACMVLQSSGSLVNVDIARGRDLVLSGPAGGVVGIRALMRRHGIAAAVGLDMGGTSTDVCRVDADAPALQHEIVVNGIGIRAPHVDVHTVASGGGSVCRHDGHALVVGPESAGAFPGPLVYGNAAAAAFTVSDANVLLGRLVDDHFSFSLDRDRARVAAERMASGSRRDLRAEDLADGFVDVVEAQMADAIRRVTVARGHNPETHALVVYGGAGGLHMCGVARRLGIRDVLVPPLAGVFSAFGMGLAREGLVQTVDVSCALDDDGVARLHEMGATVVDELKAVASNDADVRGRTRSSGDVIRMQVGVREVGMDDALDVDFSSDDDPFTLSTKYDDEARRVLGFVRDGRRREVARLTVTMTADTARDVRFALVDDAPIVDRRTTVFFGGDSLDNVRVRSRSLVSLLVPTPGPLLVLDEGATMFIAPGCDVVRLDDGTLRCRVDVDGTIANKPSSSAAHLSLMVGVFTAIAENMGEVLRRSALSVNMKERRDYSCAVFDENGDLVVNAPHIPVHLGAMSESVRATLRANPEMRPGEAYAVNDPAMGGSHLPDITVVSPVFLDDDGDAPPEAGAETGPRRPDFFVACRGHHADVGGMTAGSMPPFSTSLDDEGVVFRSEKIVDDSRFLESFVLARLAAGPFPARDPQTNVADLVAQVSANATGVAMIERAAKRHGRATLGAAPQLIHDYAEARVRAAIQKIPEGRRVFEDALDDGTPIVVAVTRDFDALTIDFTGSGPMSAENLNAPRAVTLAAVMYALRVLVDEEIPLSAGTLRPVTVVIPVSTVLSPDAGRAVCGGNVETSQRVVDVLLAAFELCAASQGTMNNLTLSEQGRSYYETIGGGAGGTPHGKGASAVQTHMTNTRITDVEILEERLPLRVLQFSKRQNSGGRGKCEGGDGVIRAFQALAPLDCTVLSERRTLKPFGLCGGESGAAGRNEVDGVDVGGKASFQLTTGSVLTIRTPGGGGYGHEP